MVAIGEMTTGVSRIQSIETKQIIPMLEESNNKGKGSHYQKKVPSNYHLSNNLIM
jgi:hypothetical protein